MTIRRSRLKKYNSLFFALGVLGCPIPKSHFLFGDLPVPHATSSRALHATTHVIVAGDPYQVHRRGSHCDWTAPGLRYKPRRWQYHGQAVCVQSRVYPWCSRQIWRLQEHFENYHVSSREVQLFLSWFLEVWPHLWEQSIEAGPLQYHKVDHWL